MVSVIIPARNETFLSETIEDIFSKAKEAIEIIVVLDGTPAVSPLKEGPNLHIIRFGKPRGMRKAINTGVSIAQGKYIMKSDAHCMYDKGLDVILK
jgi:glycosyltransferase involved in cell wall biosynthesis